MLYKLNSPALPVKLHIISFSISFEYSRQLGLPSSIYVISKKGSALSLTCMVRVKTARNFSPSPFHLSYFQKAPEILGESQSFLISEKHSEACASQGSWQGKSKAGKDWLCQLWKLIFHYTAFLNYLDLGGPFATVTRKNENVLLETVTRIWAKRFSN